MRKLYYSPKDMVMVEKHENDTTLYPMLGARGTVFAYLTRMNQLGDLKYVICSEKVVELYNDPSRIYIAEMAGMVEMLKGKGITVVTGSSDDILELQTFLTVRLKDLDVFISLYREIVPMLKGLRDEFRSSMNSLKVEGILAGQPPSVQSIYKSVTEHTKDWQEKRGYSYGVPIGMIVSEVGLKEGTIREYLNRLKALKLIKINVIDKENFYLPMET